MKEYNNFVNNLQKDFKQDKAMRNILNKIDSNPDLIYSLSNERLKQLIQIQRKDIDELKLKINMFKSNNN